jgi:hypothetical protein
MTHSQYIFGKRNDELYDKATARAAVKEMTRWLLFDGYTTVENSYSDEISID